MPSLPMLFSEAAEYFARIEATASRLEMSAIVAQLLSGCGRDEIRPLIYIIEGNVAPAHEGLDIGIVRGKIRDVLFTL